MGCCCRKRAPNDDPDPSTNLTSRDRELIRQTWALVTNKSVLDKNAVEFFIQLFRRYPDFQARFDLFKDLDEEQMRRSPNVRVHSRTVFDMISNYVENMDNVLLLVALVEKVANAHFQHGIPYESFVKLSELFPSYLQSVIGKALTTEAVHAWSTLLTTQNTVIKLKLDELDSKRKLKSGV